jgi:hypothetical protein
VASPTVLTLPPRLVAQLAAQDFPMFDFGSSLAELDVARTLARQVIAACVIRRRLSAPDRARRTA